METPTPPPTEEQAFSVTGSVFLYRLLVVTLTVILLALLYIILRELRVILQPLFIAVFVAYLILPVHHWIVGKGVPSIVAYLTILAAVLLSFFGVGTLVFSNIEQLILKLPTYELRLNKIVQSVAAMFGVDRQISIVQELSAYQWDIVAAVGTFGDFFTGLAVTFVYLIFVTAEHVSFPERLRLAFGETQGTQVLAVVESINRAIFEYLSVKTFISFLAGVFSMAVLAVFGVDFYITWGLLIFLLNFIPYIGSLVAIAPPIALSFLQLDLWQAILVTALIIGIQQVLGTLVEPRMAGQRLGVSPLLILLSLAFWGLVWGIVGMILAVPLLMILKIVLENIKETKPLALLMSNR